MQSQPPPKGSLEELFRHHLLESEAAAVPPRPLVWEQVDNSLLLAQNEKYRRRLLVHRWGMAASLLLAALAGSGWWHSQQVATTTLAGTSAQREAVRRALAGAVAPGRPATGVAEPTALASAPASARRSASSASLTESAVAGQPGTSKEASLAASRGTLAYLGQSSRQPGTGAEAGTKLAGRSQTEAAGTVASTTPSHSARPARGAGQAARTLPTRAYSLSSPNLSPIAAISTSPLVDSPETSLPVGQGTELATAAPAEAIAAENAPATALTDSRMGEGLLAGRLAALAPAANLPAELAANELPVPAPTLLRHWRYGAEYAVSAFQPNIDFNRNSTDYNQALGSNTVSLTRAAAAEYRANLRPGLGQRLTLRATRWLGGHWSLSTGVEVAQQTAYSATSAAFTGEQLADVSNFSAVSPGPATAPAYVSRELHESSFRYRSAGIPIELQYDNQAKSGVSFYGRLGAIVSALFSVRSEVAGNSEATRTYSITSASTPYRRLTALLRGSAGVRYRPAGRNWGLNMGPTAEAGVQSMNTETDRSFLQQSRPYSVGIEAGFEFGGGPKPVPAARY